MPDPPCRTTEADIERYVGQTGTEAADRARAAGDTIRAIAGTEPTLDPADVQCDRINVTTRNDDQRTIITALRY